MQDYNTILPLERGLLEKHLLRKDQTFTFLIITLVLFFLYAVAQSRNVVWQIAAILAHSSGLEIGI